MRILQANKYFYRRAGAEAIFLDTISGLRERGHDVAEFSVKHEKNLPSEYANYFITAEPELTKVEMDFGTSIRMFKHFISSTEVEKKLRALVMATEPQVAHLHNVTRQLSASTFKVLKKMGVPIALMVHDVQPLCPNHRMVVKHKLCERCYRHKYYNCVRYKCIDDSRLKSLAGSLEAYYYYLRGIWSMVDVFICYSQFMFDKLVGWGFPRDKMRLVNISSSAPAVAPPLGNKILYLNRVHEEKGIRIFMAALRQLRNYQVVIAGDGPDDQWVERYICQYGLNNVQKVGRVRGESWRQVMSQARVTVIPSLFYENCSVSILESLGHGRLVVATNRGGNSELITTGETGWLAEPDDADSLAIFIREAMELDADSTQMVINNGRRLVMDKYNVDTYFAKLEKIYSELAGQ